MYINVKKPAPFFEAGCFYFTAIPIQATIAATAQAFR